MMTATFPLPSRYLGTRLYSFCSSKKDHPGNGCPANVHIFTPPQLSAHLSLQDSETSIKAAIASRDLAAAAREDSSAMKSIAILTMFFLPGTFFAALFAMPSVGWDQPRHFLLYWAFTIPATILTFTIWAVLTQRAVVLRWTRMLSSKLPWGFWRGKGAAKGDEEMGKKVD